MAKANMPSSLSTTALAPLIVAANDHLCIRVIASESLAQRNELAPKRAMIVDLAVENDGRRARIVRHRLDTAGDVDDRQAAMAEENTPSAVDMHAVAVRTAMGERARHPDDIVACSSSCKSCDTTHESRHSASKLMREPIT